MTRTPQGPREAVAKRASTSSTGAAASSRHVTRRRGEARYQRGSRRTDAEPLAASWDPLAHRRREEASRERKKGLLATYGWRVYALPVLVVVTALAVLKGTEQPTDGSSVTGVGNLANTGPTSRAPGVPNPDPQKFAEAKAAAELPPGGRFTERGEKKWDVVPGSSERFGGPKLFRYTVEVERGVEVTGGPETFGRDVDNILRDPRSWIADEQHGFQRVDSGEPDLRISLTSQMTTRDICGFEIPFEGSCYDPVSRRVVINIARWVRGAVAFQGSYVEYKQYVINHEVGHGLGFGHKPCGENGGLAPIMMQQSWGVSNDYLATLGTDGGVTADGKVCKANAWPYPTAKAG
ncbi:hypothetical protein GCM10012275_11650 [Longimycelium tulufanense]|uniref:DUF3152 domain-containing protein n=1 Tax=Longimycelium tulufanense TaxID=907463 RepID=A0A8J3CB95_9PSEU|nr:DUF3152 domain-containing protein [Longimycelium tulufanense]GGM42315.1 hypothetical protein GCM10012275_11650 [Longimycelium tulufanense]